MVCDLAGTGVLVLFTEGLGLGLSSSITWLSTWIKFRSLLKDPIFLMRFCSSVFTGVGETTLLLSSITLWALDLCLGCLLQVRRPLLWAKSWGLFVTCPYFARKSVTSIEKFLYRNTCSWKISWQVARIDSGSLLRISFYVSFTICSRLMAWVPSGSTREIRDARMGLSMDCLLVESLPSKVLPLMYIYYGKDL